MAGRSEMTSDKLNVQCTYPECSKWFATEKEMKRHKKDDPDHYYCKRCDIDCLGWDDLTAHKVEKMAPWLEGKITPSSGETPLHIVCEFCGEDFKSFGGRKAHRELLHQAEQSIKCEGPRCGQVFARASQLIEHYEEGHCEGISYIEFMSNVTLRQIQAEIMKAPDEYAAGCNVNSAFATTQRRPGLISDVKSESEYQDSEAGGISILDADDGSQKIGYTSLKPEVDLMDFRESRRVPLTRSNLESWPRLPHMQKSELPDMLGKMSIRSPASSVPVTSAREFASSITLGPKTPSTESYPVLASPASDVSAKSRTASVASSAGTTTTLRSAAWNTGNTSRALFKEVRPMSPGPDYWRNQIAQRQGPTADDKTNLLRKRYWDPSNAEYSVERFRHDVIGKYCCPFGGCDCDYEDPIDLSDHFKIAHIKKDYRCSLCLKIFHKGSALMAHAEAAGGKCRVKETDMFGQLLEMVSGGFLKAEQVKQPKIVKFDQKAIVKKDDVVEGVMSTRFNWKDPNAPKEEDGEQWNRLSKPGFMKG